MFFSFLEPELIKFLPARPLRNTAGREQNFAGQRKNFWLSLNSEKAVYNHLNRTLTGVVSGEPVSGPAGAVVSMRCVHADLAAAPVVRVALLAAAQLPRLVLKVAAIVDQVADPLQRQANSSVAAIKLRLGIAGEQNRFVVCNREEVDNDGRWDKYRRCAYHSYLRRTRRRTPDCRSILDGGVCTHRSHSAAGQAW